jgi:hypothetical protein
MTKLTTPIKAFIACLAGIVFLLEESLSQCNVVNTLSVLDSPNQTVIANMECTDTNGWTHYFNSVTGRIMLSVKKNGQNIGSLSGGLSVKSGTLSGYGAGGFDLSNADYIDNDIWITSQRYWQVTGANTLNSPVRVRYYFDNEDVSDIAKSVDDFGFLVDEPEDLYMFTLRSGNGLYPFSTVTQPSNAVFTLYDMAPGAAPDWTKGTLNGIPYAEFEVPTLDIGGGAGFLIFLQQTPLSISGKITKPNNFPVPQASVTAAGASIGISDAAGHYTCPSLLPGGTYEIIPEKNILPAEGISIIDLIKIVRHVLGLETLGSPYQIIAADANKTGNITLDDMEAVKAVLLGESTTFPNNDSWRFTPKTYAFPNPGNPFNPPFPEQIQVQNLSNDLDNQDFIGIKTGDVAEESVVVPPALNTAFALSNESACNPGDTVEFALTVVDFQGIRGFQFTIEWDQTDLQFLASGNFGLPGFNQQNFGTNATQEGKLSAVWINPANTGSTVSNGTAICRLFFINLGNHGANTPVSFTGSLTPILLAHQNLSQVQPAFSNGSFHVDNTSLLQANANVQAAGCNGEPVGSIDLTVTGAFIPPITYHWSNGSTSQDLFNVSGGIYSVTITDNSGFCPLVRSFTVTPVQPVTPVGNVTDMSCPSLANGSINLTILGGTSPFTYYWSNGASTQNISNLYIGNYTVTVTDANGCTGSASFDIENPNVIFPNVSIMNASSDTTANGAVNILEIAGGVPPFSFLWNTGATTQSLQGVLSGDYIVTITDGGGCEHVFGYIVNILATGTDETNAEEPAITIFPNPAKAGQQVSLRLERSEMGPVTIEIYSLDGKLGSRETTFILPGQPVGLKMPAGNGVFLVRLETNDGVYWAKVLIL